MPIINHLNTLYIISKGRPWCKTAQELERMEYPGEWFIVCGTNDETLSEYQERWGEHVLVFDWHKWSQKVDVLDNFGFDNMASGAAPVRNATRWLAEQRGDVRHWQFDDDYNGFYICDRGNTTTKHRMTGQELFDNMLMLSEYANACGMQNCGFALGTIESAPISKRKILRRVFNAHNMPTNEQYFQKWRGRMNDDLINAIEVWRNGGYEILFRFMSITMKSTQKEAGGLTELYQAEGTVRKTAYAILLAPNQAKLVVDFGRYHHRVNWMGLMPKLLRESFKK